MISRFSESRSLLHLPPSAVLLLEQTQSERLLAQSTVSAFTLWSDFVARRDPTTLFASDAAETRIIAIVGQYIRSIENSV